VDDSYLVHIIFIITIFLVSYITYYIGSTCANISVTKAQMGQRLQSIQY
jgi:hypothetical protein